MYQGHKISRFFICGKSTGNGTQVPVRVITPHPEAREIQPIEPVTRNERFAKQCRCGFKKAQNMMTVIILFIYLPRDDNGIRDIIQP